jgi:hypothetical protein
MGMGMELALLIIENKLIKGATRTALTVLLSPQEA